MQQGSESRAIIVLAHGSLVIRRRMDFRSEMVDFHHPPEQTKRGIHAEHFHKNERTNFVTSHIKSFGQLNS